MQRPSATPDPYTHAEKLDILVYNDMFIQFTYHVRVTLATKGVLQDCKALG